jgi:hypothetical protein
MTAKLRFNIFKFSWINHTIKIKSASSNAKSEWNGKLWGYHNAISIISTHENNLDILELEKFKELTSKLAQEGEDILCALRWASLYTLNNHFNVHRCKQKNQWNMHSNTKQ